MSGLISFEAVARLAGFSAAAAELNLTQAAVSRNVKVLEDYLGVALVDRSGRRMTMTSAGRDYYSGVVVILEQLRGETQRLRSHHARSHFEVAVTNATASLWLFPRLSRFRKLYPEIQLRILCFENEVDLLSASVDVAILYGRNRWKDLDAELLFEEDSFPVCSPSYLDDYGPIDDATDLVRHTLIECEYQHPEWPDWQKWLRHHGVSTAAASKRITVSDYPLSIEGARDGLGLALGGTQFLWRDLSKRTLVRPFGGKMLTGWGFYLLRQRGIPVSPELATFRDWLHFEADEIVEGKE